MLRRRTLAALALALLLAGSAAANAAPPAAAKTYPTGRFEVAGKPVPPTAVLDARALPDMQGKPSLMVTLAPATAAVLAAGANGTVAATLDGKPLGTSPADALRTDHVLQLSGAFGDYPATAAIARRISGRDPLPDSESDE
jgi:hypothetical protein